VSDYLQLLLVFFAAINPAAVALAASDLRDGAKAHPLAVAASGFVLAAMLYLVAASTADSLLDFLDVAPETFRIAAGIVMATTGVYAVWRARIAVSPSEESWQDAIFPLAIPLLASPAGLIAALSYGADDGVVKAFGAAIVALAAAATLAVIPLRRGALAADAVARLLGALLVVVAAGLVVEGVRDI
jgi:small neutral amino acid transporter SnatA (MarC family)